MLYAKTICDGLRQGDIAKPLHLMYTEAVYGKNVEVRKRIISRVYSIGSLDYKVSNSICQ